MHLFGQHKLHSHGPQTLLVWRAMREQSQVLEGVYSLGEEKKKKAAVILSYDTVTRGKHRLPVPASTPSSLLPKSNAEALVGSRMEVSDRSLFSWRFFLELRREKRTKSVQERARHAFFLFTFSMKAENEKQSFHHHQGL